jgi:hypothetical protein
MLRRQTNQNSTGKQNVHSFALLQLFVAFLSTGSLSTSSQIDSTAYANLILALLTGNTELATRRTIQRITCSNQWAQTCMIGE